MLPYRHREPLLLLVLSTCLLHSLVTVTQAQIGEKQLCDGKEFRSILEGVELPSCLAAYRADGKPAGSNCLLMRHLEKLAKEQGKSLDSFISRVSVMIFAHSEFIDEMTVPNNPTLDIAADLERHNAFFGVTKCLKSADSTCQRLRTACTGGYVSNFVFLISGHCSKKIRCSLIESKEKEQPTSLLNMLQYVHFRMLERQAFIAKEFEELRLSTSTGTEYLIQSELDDSRGKQLNSAPVVVFSAGPVKNLAYYQQLAWFLDVALSLKSGFAFHLIATPLSYIEDESERPLYRWKIREHQSFLALYTEQLCSYDAKWVFGCKPLMKLAKDMLIQEQYYAFMLHGVLAANSMPGTPYPTFKSATIKELGTFVSATGSYVLSVMPEDELLTDPNISHEMMESLVSYLGSSFSITYYPVVLNKATAIEILADLKTGLNLQEAFKYPCFFIRMPNGASALLKIDEPIATLDSTVRDIANEGNYKIMLESAREIFNSEMTELPEKLVKSGHIVGEVARADEDSKDLVDEIRIRDRTDAFVEQLSFKDVYNVTNVLVIETDAKLMSNFFSLAGKDKPWMVLFTVSWSPLCKAARSVWASVGDCIKRMDFPNVPLVKVDCFEANEICQKLGIYSYPTITMFSKGVQMNTYTGPVISDELCLYAKLAFEPPAISTNSEQETQRLLDKIFELKSRAFVFRGAAEMPSQLAAFAKSRRFREVFIHEKIATKQSSPQLMAVHRDAKPKSNQYTGSLDDASALADYLENSHLDSVFPCTWDYLPSALRRQRPLAILFHIDRKDESADLLQHLLEKFSGRATICHMNLRRFDHLNDLVYQLAGLNLPVLVALTKPANADNKLIHRLPLGKLAAAEQATRTVEWLELAVTNKLTGGKAVQRQQPWQPATKVFNFVDQVYHGKTEPAAGQHRTHGSRAFMVDIEPAGGAQSVVEDDDSSVLVDASVLERGEAFAKTASRSAKDEL